jgi:hypothetical protein
MFEAPTIAEMAKRVEMILRVRQDQLLTASAGIAADREEIEL